MMRTRARLALPLVVLLALGGLARPTPAAAQSISCSTNRETRQPVLLVHGYNSGPNTWGTPARTQLARAGDNTCIDVFDYSAHNDRWATNPHLGPALAARIDQLSSAFSAGGGSGKIIIVAHSNGGLVTRCAASSSCNGGRRHTGDHIAELISFGTPNLGSWLVNGATKGLGDLLSATCSLIANRSNRICTAIRTLGTSEATRGFTPGSAQLRALPQLPTSVPVFAVAGNLTVVSRFFGLVDVDAGNAGDAIVLTDSATAAARRVGRLGGQTVIDCGRIVINDLLTSDYSCWHGTETNDTRFLGFAAHQIELVEAADAARQTRTVLLAPVTASGTAVNGWHVDSSQASVPISCFSSGPLASPAAVTGNIYFCGTTADSAIACWLTGKVDLDAVLCLADPFTRTLRLRLLDGDGLPQPVRPYPNPSPLGMDLADGNHCSIRTGGAVDRSTQHPDWSFDFYCDKTEAVWGPPALAKTGGIDKSSSTWTVWIGQSTQPLHTVAVTRAYYVTTAG